MIHRELGGFCYHAARGFLDHLLDELPERDRVDGELVTVLGPRRRTFWTRNVWLSPILIEYSSVGDAAKKLRDIQRNWVALPARLFRRAALIAERLPPLPTKPKPFPFEVPATPMGAFTLLDEGMLLASPSCSSPFPGGEFEFEEDHEGPPSRAYRKLWEALLLAGRMPGRGEHCLDAGAAPGGWTWALAGLGASVLAIDRADLDPRISAMPGVESRRGDAFALGPQEVGAVDWLFSDVIAYPPALLAWVERWVDSGLAKNMICTIKMQGDFDRATTERFAAIPGSRVVHLWHNRHELCWIRVAGDRGLGS
ncbi:MAG TPA: SAM-dependent methyltransferase [Rectinemataceae bacterium]|nr:SAM-dependent methyltransferase [Rectinemataceae bacterium]